MVKRRTFLFAIIILLTGGFVISCTYHRQHTLKTSEIDDILEHRLETRQFDNALSILDSLEEAGSMTKEQLCYWRGELCHKMHKRTEAEAYFRMGLDGDIYSQKNRIYYYWTASSLADMLAAWNKDHENCLKIAMPAIAAIEERNDTSVDVYPTLLYTIGNSQLRLDKFQEGNATLKRAMDILDQRVLKDTVGHQSYNRVVMLTNIVIVFVNRNRYQEAEEWLHRAESALKYYAAQPTAQSERVDRAHGRICLLLAEILENLDRHKEAVVAYLEATKTDFLKTTDGKLDATAYLQAAGRWQEAADIYMPLDSILASWNSKLTLRTLSGLMMSKFRSNLGAGRRDSAFATSIKICNALDSAIAWERNDKASELATVYETHEKEKTIHQQELQLANLRTIAILVGLLLLVVFIGVHYYHRYSAAMSLKSAHDKLRKAYAELEEKNADLAVANARAEESSKMKTNFIQQISHEIRTPLNILSGFTQIVTTPGMDLDDETKADINKKITDNTTRITGLVNKMLELSEINSRSDIDRPDDVSATQIASIAVEESEIEKAPHLNFKLEVGEGSYAKTLHTNVISASRALGLLLDNAAKFTHPAEAHARNIVVEKKERVTLKIETSEQQARFIVEDTGIGVPPEEAEHIFEEFVQLDEYYDGTGIGLTVARNLARRLGGDITIDTTYQGGARFILTLPFA